MKFLWILSFIVVYSGYSNAVETAFSCLSGTLQLQCPGDKYIDGIAAFYGQWYEVCDDCCPPGPRDCDEDMSQVALHSDDYEMILETCKNETQCEVQLFQEYVYSCPSPSVAQYAFINYTCYPEDPTTPPPTTSTTTTPRPTQPPPQVTTKKDDGGGGGGGGTQVAAIVGGVVAAILLIVLIILLVYLYIRMKRKPPPKKRPIRIVKRPSGAQRPPGQPARANNYLQSNAKPAKNTNQPPAKSQPIPPYVAYDNKAYEQEVEIVTEKKQLVNGCLAGTADIKGNVPNMHSNGNTHYENIDNTHREMAKPRSASKNNGQVPKKSDKPSFSRASKPVTPSAQNSLSTSKDSYYDTPRPAQTKPGKDMNSGQRPRSETKSSTASSNSDRTHIALKPGDESVRFKNKPAKNDVYEDIDTKA